MPCWCWIILRGSLNVVWTLYQVFEELGWQWRTFIHLNCHHLKLSRTLKLKNLGLYSHKCCHGDMPWGCWIIFRGSLNVVWTLYQVFEELGWQWRTLIVLSSVCTFIRRDKILVSNVSQASMGHEPWQSYLQSSTILVQLWTNKNLSRS